MKGCGQTNIPETDNTQLPCEEFVSTDCVIYPEAILPFGIVEDTDLTTVIKELVKRIRQNKLKINQLEYLTNDLQQQINNITEVEGVERDFFITGDGQINPIVFNAGFEGGLVSTTRTLIKKVGEYNYYRVEISGQITIPSTFPNNSVIITDMPDDYKPLLGSLTTTNPSIVIGNMSVNFQTYPTSLDVAYEPFFNRVKLQQFYNTPVRDKGYINLVYFSSDKPYPTLNS